jgi:hypothetical protein
LLERVMICECVIENGSTHFPTLKNKPQRQQVTKIL